MASAPGHLERVNHGVNAAGWTLPKGKKLHVSIAERKEGWDKGKNWAGALAARAATYPRAHAR